MVAQCYRALQLFKYVLVGIQTCQILWCCVNCEQYPKPTDKAVDILGLQTACFVIKFIDYIHISCYA